MLGAAAIAAAGFVAGVNFSLAPDQAMIVNTWPGGAKYTGFQINDPWMIAPDARTRQVRLNSSQTALNREVAKRGVKRLFLHAQRLAFAHPLTGERLRLQAPLPADMAAFAAAL